MIRSARRARRIAYWALAGTRDGCAAPINRRLFESLEPRLMLCGAASPIALSCLLPEYGGDGSYGVVFSTDREAATIRAAGIGDFNGDGFHDFALLSKGDVTSRLFMGQAAFPPYVDMNSPEGLASVRLPSALAVSGAGDFNGDGLSDLVLGQPAAGNWFGEVSVFFGRTETLTELTVDELDGTNGFTIKGPNFLAAAGTDVQFVGDVNGDGLDDLVVGVPYAINPIGVGQPGHAYVVYGQPGAYPLSTLEPFEHLTGELGSLIMGPTGTEAPLDLAEFGFQVTGVGDVNGDRLDDFHVVAGQARERSPIIFGNASGHGDNLGFVPEFTVDDIDGENGFFPSASVTGLLGDFNGDGVGDLLLDNSIWLGQNLASSPDQPMDVSATISFPGASAVYRIGDVDGDGYDDVLVVKGRAEGSGSSRFRIVFGGPDWQPSDIPYDDLSEEQSREFIGIGQVENELDSAELYAFPTGDVNGDGFADFLIVAREHSESSEPPLAMATLVFGRDFRGRVTHAGTANDDVLIGSEGAEILIGGLGDDVLISGGGADSLYGGAGDDVLVLRDTSFVRVDGGTGFDTLRWEANDEPLDLIEIGPYRLQAIEQVDLRGAEASRLVLDRLAVLKLSPTTNDLRVLMDRQDTIEFQDDWTFEGLQPMEGRNWHVYAAGHARVLIADFPPEIVTPIPDQVVAVNAPLGAIPFDIWEPDGGGDEIVVSVWSSNEALLPVDRASVEGEGTRRSLALQPLEDVIGETTITIILSNGNDSSEAQFVLSVMPVSHPDDQLTVDGDVVMENVPGATVGRVIVVSLYGHDQFSYTTSDPRFEVVDDELRLLPDVSLDHEEAAVVSLTVTATGSAGFAVSGLIEVHVADENEFDPVLLTTELFVDENSPAGTEVGMLIAYDGDTSQQVSFAFISGPTSPDGWFELDSQTGVVTTTAEAVLDYETQAVYAYEVILTDDGTPPRSSNETLAIHVRDINEPPTGLQYSSTSIDEDADTSEPLFLVSLVVIDEDQPYGPFEFDILDVAEYPDSSYFEIQEPMDGFAELYLAAGTPLDYRTKSQYDILIRVVDGPHVRDFPFQLVIDRVEQPPHIDLDGSGTPDGDWHPEYLHGLGPQPLFSADSLVTTESPFLRVRVTLDVADPGQEILVSDDVDVPGFSWDYDPLAGEWAVSTANPDPSAGLTAAQVTALLHSIRYQHLGNSPTGDARTVRVELENLAFTYESAPFTLTIDPDGDGDGVPTSEENEAPNNGDGNDDGIPDAMQNLVVSLRDATERFHTLVVCDDAERVRNVRFSPPPAPLAMEFDLPGGVLEFEIDVSDAGASCEVRTMFDVEQPENTWLIPTSDGDWIPFFADAETGQHLEEGRVHLVLRDGGRGDADGEADGRIRFIGALAVLPNDRLWNNPLLREDVNGDGLISPLDALLVIDHLNQPNNSLPPKPFLEGPFVDVNGDGQISPLDALLVINRLNSAGANGEEPVAGGLGPSAFPSAAFPLRVDAGQPPDVARPDGDRPARETHARGHLFARESLDWLSENSHDKTMRAERDRTPRAGLTSREKLFSEDAFPDWLDDASF